MSRVCYLKRRPLPWAGLLGLAAFWVMVDTAVPGELATDRAVAAAYGFLYRQMDQTAQAGPRFVQSYLPNGCGLGAPENAAYVYDQALVLLALLARGTPEDLHRADLLADALVQAQDNDRTFRGGRLRNAYASGPVLDPGSGQARLPGRWDAAQRRYLEDEYAAGSDTGNAAWAALALVQGHALLPHRAGEPYLTAARRLGTWIVQASRADDARGGFRGGVEGFESPAGAGQGQAAARWRSTEHNIDLVALFGQLARAVGRDSAEGRNWLAQQAHARQFVDSMMVRDRQGAHLMLGTDPAGGINRAIIPLDAQTWAVLAMGGAEPYRSALDWALRHCGAKTPAHAFEFNCEDGDGAWWEGTAQVAVALRRLGRNAEAVPMLDTLMDAQITQGPAAGALPAASVCGLTTGLGKRWHADNRVTEWRYPNSPHIGATAWYLFALLGTDPFDLR